MNIAASNEFATSIQHIGALGVRVQKLTALRAAAEDQLFYRAGRMYTAGEIGIPELCALRDSVRPVASTGWGGRWNDNIPIRHNAVSVAGRNSPTGVDGRGRDRWNGAYPLGRNDPRPPPRQPVVYVLFSAGSACYVGSTHAFASRLKAHRKVGKVFDSWVAHAYGTRSEAYAAEAQFIDTYMPSLNKRREGRR